MFHTIEDTSKHWFNVTLLWKGECHTIEVKMSSYSFKQDISTS